MIEHLYTVLATKFSADHNSNYEDQEIELVFTESTNQKAIAKAKRLYPNADKYQIIRIEV